MLEEQDHCQHKDSQQQIFHGAEIFGCIAAAKGVDADGNQAQTNGHNHRAGYNGREEFAQRLQEEAKDTFKQAADNRRAHDGTVGNHAAAHRCGDRVKYAQEAGGGTHDDGDIAADGTDGEQLNQGDKAGYQHGILQKMQLQICKLTGCDSAGTGNDQQGSQVADEHSQNMLKTRGIA